MWPRGHVLWLDIGPFEEQLFCEASQENSHNARARTLRGEGIRVPGSKEDSFFCRFYRIPCVGFLPSVGNVGWFTTACLKIENCGTTAFLHIYFCAPSQNCSMRDMRISSLSCGLCVGRRKGGGRFHTSLSSPPHLFASQGTRGQWSFD